MATYINLKKNYPLIAFLKLGIASIIIGVLSSFLAISLKRITEYFESAFYNDAFKFHFYYYLFPFIGLGLIYLLRLYLFKNNENKGIKEVVDVIQNSSKKLPPYKIPSHFINGFFTVLFGGSTGIEVSTVVASATIGSVAQQKANFFRKYKDELISAGVSAGITALFGSPIAGILFSLEVISRKKNTFFWITNLCSVAFASALVYILNEPILFYIKVITWHYHAIPYFIILGIAAGFNSVFLTRTVLFCKTQYQKIPNQYHRIVITSLLLGTAILMLPTLYGDGYHGIKEIVLHSNALFSLSFGLTILGILILKPIATALTLAAGGDGGVFAPSLVIGAFLGYFVATICNTYFHASVIPLNFIIIGMAALLSASIHAPFTAIFLVCSIVNDYTLMIPLLLTCLISMYTAKYLFPYTVYSFVTSKPIVLK